jgi:hypothetical protein
VRTAVILGSIALGLLLVALTLPSARDRSVAGWWRRVRFQTALALRIALVVGIIAMAAGFVLPMLGWG